MNFWNVEEEKWKPILSLELFDLRRSKASLSNAKAIGHCRAWMRVISESRKWETEQTD